MKVRRVFVKAVIRRQIHTAAKPAHRLLTGVAGGNHAHIHVYRRHVRIARVEHQRHAHRLERRAGQLGAVLRRRWRQLRPAHMGETAAGALKHAPAFDDLRAAVALQRRARLFAPRVDQGAHAFLGIPLCCRCLRLDGFERGDDARLQADQITTHLGHGAFRVELLAHGVL